MDSIEELRYLILAAQREGNRALAEALRPFGLTPSKAEALRVLGDYAPLTLAELGDLLVCEAGGSPSRLVQGLVDDALIEKTSSLSDKRVVMLSLTENGKQKAAQVSALETRFYELNAGLLKDAPVPEIIAFLWLYVSGKPAGLALARRKEGKTAEKTIP